LWVSWWRDRNLYVAERGGAVGAFVIDVDEEAAAGVVAGAVGVVEDG